MSKSNAVTDQSEYKLSCKHPVVVGLGATGVSVVRYLLQQGLSPVLVDSRLEPPALAELKALAPELEVHLGALTQEPLLQADLIVVSPGVDLQTPLWQQVRTAGITICGDIELFVRAVQVPIIAITGTNGKSTVTVLTAEALAAAGYTVATLGNIGTPVLDFLTRQQADIQSCSHLEHAPQLAAKQVADTDQPLALDYIVLELSSFQLASTFSLAAKVAVCLNVSPDHLDRHGDMADYLAAKQRIYKHCQHAVLNLQQPEIWQSLALPVSQVGFCATALAIQAPQVKSLTEQADPFSQLQHIYWLAEEGVRPQLMCDNQPLLSVSDLAPALVAVPQNVLAVMAIMHALQIPVAKYGSIIHDFVGLAHRCQKVLTTTEGTMWFNDSKATNVGAAIAAVKGVSAQINGKLVWIAGGQTKGVDMQCLAPIIRQHAAAMVLLGDDVQQLQQQVPTEMPCAVVRDMQAAVQSAAAFAAQYEVQAVLLAPAGASFDLFKNYQDRGEQFTAWVNAICH